MTLVSPKSRAARPTSQAKTPGRLYTFAVTLLAALIAGITVSAIQLPTSNDADAVGRTPASLQETTTRAVGVTHAANVSSSPARRITRDQLRQLGGIALGLAILSLIPSRKAGDESNALTPQAISHSTGLPVLGALFASSKSPSRSPGRGRLVRAWVSMCEMSLCIAFMLTLAACFSKPELFTILRHDPLAGYTAAVGHLTGIVHGWLHPGVTLT